MAGERFRDDQPCLDRFAETDVVCDQDSRRRATDERKRWFKLIGEDRDISRCGRAQRVHRRYGARQHAARQMLPPSARDHARRVDGRQTFDRLEREEVSCPAPAICAVTADDRENGGVTVWGGLRDGPTFVTDAYDVTSLRRGSGHAGSGADVVPS